MQKISQLILKVIGWKLDDESPQHHRYVLIAYPHTSNWDFIIGMLAMWGMKMPLNWVAKHSMFWGPFGPLFKAIGGIPLNREKSVGFIQKNIDLFEQREEFVLGLMPEGTRSKTSHLKSGFYHIASGANVPVALAYLDYKNKVVGVGKVIELSGDIDADFEVIKVFYQDKTACKPENASDLIISASRNPDERQ